MDSNKTIEMDEHITNDGILDIPDNENNQLVS